MANGSHGSPERMPGALFRAVGALFLHKKDVSREALARELKEHTLTNVAQDLGVTRERVRQIQVKALASLRQLRLLQGLARPGTGKTWTWTWT